MGKAMDAGRRGTSISAVWRESIFRVLSLAIVPSNKVPQSNQPTKPEQNHQDSVVTPQCLRACCSSTGECSPKGFPRQSIRFSSAANKNPQRCSFSFASCDCFWQSLPVSWGQDFLFTNNLLSVSGAKGFLNYKPFHFFGYKFSCQFVSWHRMERNGNMLRDTERKENFY